MKKNSVPVVFVLILILSAILLTGCPGRGDRSPVTSVAGTSQEYVLGNPGLSSALDLLKTGRYSGAEAAFRKFLESNPRDNEARLSLANALYEQRKLGDAENEIKEVLKNNPRSIRARDQLVRVYLERYNYGQAEALAREAIKIAPASSTGWSALGYTELSKGEFEKSKEAYQKALKFNQDDSSALTGFGELLLRTGDEAESESVLKRATRIDQYESRPRVVLGELYRGQGKYAKAETEFFKALELEPESNEDIYAELGALYVARYKISRAREAYKKGLSNPRNLHCMADSYAGLGVVAFKEKQYDIADENFRNAMKYNPGDPLFYRNLMHNRVYRDINSIKNIETPARFRMYYLFPVALESSLDNLLKVQPENYEARCIQGFVYLWGRGDLENARKSFSTAMDKESDVVDSAMVGLGFVSLLKGSLENGVKYFNNARDEKHSESTCYLGLGLAALLNNEPGRATEMFDKAIRFSGGDPLIELEIAGQYNLAKKPREAHDYLTLGIARHENNPEFLAGLVEFYFILGEDGKIPGLLQKLAGYVPKAKNAQWVKYFGATVSRKGSIKEADKILDELAKKHPGDPDYKYFQAVNFAREGKNEAAVKSLEEAVNIMPGLVNQAAAEPAFRDLKRNEEYAEIITRAVNQPGGMRIPSGTVKD
ncbi:MAG: tetratricopeptide repeat protein [Chloroflexi bacterium]|nr:tetratricopeptide repeat protein [Chloroflexota bacterium]